jgi:hypothetical protein
MRSFPAISVVRLGLAAAVDERAVTARHAQLGLDRPMVPVRRFRMGLFRGFRHLDVVGASQSRRNPARFPISLEIAIWRLWLQQTDPLGTTLKQNSR